MIGGEFRSLEQIKVRDNKITLRSKEANEAMASYYEHRVTNPTQKLMFRFMTNARVGKERSPWNMEEKAIVNWDNIILLGLVQQRKFNHV